MKPTEEEFEAWFKKAREDVRQLSRTDFFLARTYGARCKGDPVFEPFEFGYQCPACGATNITWSEFNEHIWCYCCNLDILTRKCPIKKPEWMDAGQFYDFIKNLPFEAIIKP